MNYLNFRTGIFAVVTALVSCNAIWQKREEAPKLEYVPFNETTITDDFWKPKIERAIDVTVPHIMRICLEAGYVDNFAIVAGLKQGEYNGLFNWDEVLYKEIETVSYSLMYRYNEKLDRQLDSIIAILAKAQDSNGYIDSHVQYSEKKGVWPKSERFNRENRSLELYNCGHIIEAAVAHYQATGKKSLLDIAIKYADLVDSFFGPNGKKDILGHAEIELALPRLYEVTGDEKYLNLAQFFIDMRGNPERPKLYGEFLQDQIPFVKQTVATGQAPRATYLYSGAADLSYFKSKPDYDKALQTLWEDVVYRKMYITGGIGSQHENEGFGEPYFLPNLKAYSEICAAVSFSMWNARMFKIDQDGKYFDILERTCYNNLLAGPSISGNSYFYACPLESDGNFKFNIGWMPGNYKDKYSDASATRKEWFPCACCPPNYARFLLQLPEYIYAHKRNELYINLFIGSSASVVLDGREIIVSQETDYPWDGKVRIKINPAAKSTSFILNVRIPSWATGQVVPGDLYHFSDTRKIGYELKINGEKADYRISNGFASINRKWKKGDIVEIELPMVTQLVESNPAVAENQGKVAIQRGPLVYCMESIDNDHSLNEVYVDENTTEPEEIWDGDYNGFMRLRMHNKSGTFNAIPYYLWSNRGENEMKVWITRH